MAFLEFPILLVLDDGNLVLYEVEADVLKISVFAGRFHCQPFDDASRIQEDAGRFDVLVIEILEEAHRMGRDVEIENLIIGWRISLLVAFLKKNVVVWEDFSEKGVHIR